MHASLKRAAPALLALLLSLPAAAQMSAYGDAARVNGVAISNETFERSFEEYMKEQRVNIGAVRYPGRIEQLRQELLDKLIARELLYQEARRSGVEAPAGQADAMIEQVASQFESRDSFLSRIRIEGYTQESYREHMAKIATVKAFTDRIRDGVEVGDEAVHAFYVDNPEKFTRPEEVRARHILIKVAMDAGEEAWAEARARLEALRARARAGEDFAALAREHSDDGSAPSGGDLGFFTRGRMVPAFEHAAFGLEPGQVSEIVRTRYGLHIIELVERRGGDLVPEADVRERVREHLRSVEARGIVQHKVAELRAAADIEILTP